jgi:hypothetical protein
MMDQPIRCPICNKFYSRGECKIVISKKEGNKEYCIVTCPNDHEGKLVFYSED